MTKAMIPTMIMMLIIIIMTDNDLSHDYDGGCDLDHMQDDDNSNDDDGYDGDDDGHNDLEGPWGSNTENFRSIGQIETLEKLGVGWMGVVLAEYKE